MKITPTALALSISISLLTTSCQQQKIEARHQKPSTSQAQAQPALTEIAFGSCTNEEKPQPIWKSIAATKPQLFLYLGDNVYADSSAGTSLPVATEASFQKAYDTLAKNQDFAKFRQTVPIIASWDDHDTGFNDGGRDNPVLPMAKQFWLNFFNIPADSPIRQRDGIYDAKILGPKGQRVQIIILDTRSFRSALTKAQPGNKQGYQRYRPSTDKNQQMLGENQWQWLQQQLQQPAELRIIASSIQVIAKDHGYERWGNLPKELKRLYQLLKTTKAQGVILISGDRHTGSIYQRDDILPYPLIEMTSSSLNKPIKNPSYEMDTYQKGEMVVEPNFGSISIDWQTKTTELSLNTQAQRKLRTISFSFSSNH